MPKQLQRTREWWVARRGKITSSRARTIINGTVRGWHSLAIELRAELLSPEPIIRDIHTHAIDHGVEYEPAAIADAELILGERFKPVGFVQHKQYDFIGCSSDFLARRRKWNGEVKCPQLAEHMRTYMSRQLPPQYVPQVQFQMMVHDVKWTLFISHHPNPAHWKMKTVILEIPRDDAYCERMLARCLEFKRFLDAPELGRAPVIAAKLPQYF